MKKLLYILLFVPLPLLGQTIETFSASLGEEICFSGSNMTVGFNPQISVWSHFVGSVCQAYQNGNPVSEAEEITNSFFALAIWGNDSYCSSNSNNYDVIEFYILTDDKTIIQFETCYDITYISNQVYNILYECVTFYIDGYEVQFGCTDPAYLEFDSYSNLDDGSCEVLRIDGCTDSHACNYYSEANFDDGSCVYAQQYYDCENVCLEDSDLDGVCDELEIPGCQDPTYLEYNPSATDEDGSCNTPVIFGCTYSLPLTITLWPM